MASDVPAALAVIDRVHRAAQELRTSENADLNWIAETLHLWMTGASFDDAVGVAPGWREAMQQRAQTEALRAMMRDLPPGSVRSAANEIADRLLTYEATAWRVDRVVGRRPSDPAGHLFDFLRADGPRSAERIRKLLAWVAEVDDATHVAA